MRIVDPHVHIWDLATGLYPSSELRGEAGDGFILDKVVNMEAFPNDPLAETTYLQNCSDSTFFPIGIVAAADLSSANADAALNVQLEFRNVRGIRQVLNRHNNPLYNYISTDLLSNTKWHNNLALLTRRDLSFDLQIYPRQVKELLPSIARHSSPQFILNHAGMWVDRDADGFRQWRASLRELASSDNMSVKISGFGMLDHQWTEESIRPLTYEIIDAFGTKRCMFASNFLISKLFSVYQKLWAAFSTVVEAFNATEKADLFACNAERIYRV